MLRVLVRRFEIIVVRQLWIAFLRVQRDCWRPADRVSARRRSVRFARRRRWRSKYERASDVPTEGRFALSEHYRARYWNEANFAALALLRAACAANGIVVASAALRWLARHSKLDAARGDAIIVGATSGAHVESNVAACRNAEPLPPAVVAALDEAWRLAAPHTASVGEFRCRFCISLTRLHSIFDETVVGG